MPTPSPSANAHSLITWQTIRPSTSPGASSTQAVCLPSVAKKRSAASAAATPCCQVPVSARPAASRRAAAARGIRRRRRRGRARRASRPRSRSPADRPRAGPRAPRRLWRSRISSGGWRSPASSGSSTSQPACAAASRSSIASGVAPGDHDDALAAARRQRLRVGCPVGVGTARVVVVAPAGLAARPARSDELDRHLRRAPARLAEALLVERARDVEADVDPDQVGQLERAHPEAAVHPADPVDLLDRRDPLLEQPLCLRAPNGRLQRLTRKPGPSTASITTLPIASPVARASARASSEDSSPATTSSSRISGAGLKKCIPTTRSGRLAALAIAVTSSEEVFVASTHSSETTSSDSCLEQLLLELEALGGGLDHELARRQVARARRAGSSRSAAAVASSSLQRPRSAPRSRWPLICSSPALERLGERVVQQRPRPGQAGELGDPGAHRAGAGDADRVRALRRPLGRGRAR